MKIKKLSAMFLALTLAQQSVAMPLFELLPNVARHVVQHADTFVQTQSPYHKIVQIYELKHKAAQLAAQSHYPAAIDKTNQAIDLFHKQKAMENNEFSQIVLESSNILFDLYNNKTRYLIDNDDLDDAKHNAQQTFELIKQMDFNDADTAIAFYNIAHEMNQTAYAFADDANEHEFAQQIRAQIQQIFDEIISKHPDLKQAFSYNNACLAAMRGDTQTAIAQLNLANQQHGYLSREKIDQDRDFDTIRQQPEFQQWLKTTFAKKTTIRKKKK